MLLCIIYVRILFAVLLHDGRRHVKYAHYDAFHNGVGLVLRQAHAQAVVDVRNFEPLYRVVHDVGHESYVFDAEASFVNALLQHLLQDAVLFYVKGFAHLFYHPDVAENSARSVPLRATVSRMMLRWV